MAALTFLEATSTLSGLRHPREAGRERLMVDGELCQLQKELACEGGRIFLFFHPWCILVVRRQNPRH
jgi:hypothetical protein